jgi:transposase-like protein
MRPERSYQPSRPIAGTVTATKRVKGSNGEVALSVPRDREGSFEPELVKKGQTRIDGVDDKIIGLYAAGLSVRDIQAHLEDLYGLRVSPDLISRVATMPCWRGSGMAAPGAGPDVSHCDL